MSDVDPRDQPGELRADEGLDLERLAAFVAPLAPDASAPLVVKQFRKGHSNLTYLLQKGEREWVLRRAPFGAKIKTAHDMHREHSILSALAPVWPLAPRPVAFCDDESLIGARFYLMDRVHGVILRGTSAPPGVTLDAGTMRRLSAALIDGLAELHAVDWRAAGLGELGRPEGYVGRQVRGWSERYDRARTDDIPSLARVAGWLAAHQPGESGAALIHNDYKYDNVVLDPADLARIVAVLDWEMATVGDPLMDLGTTLGYWVDPDDAEELRLLPIGPTMLPGNLSRRELVERYAERSGRPVGDMLFHYVFALFKIAVIAQQIYQRWVAGHTRDPRFGALIVGVRILGEQAVRALDKGRIHTLG